jgi:hypothetical protein
LPAPATPSKPTIFSRDRNTSSTALPLSGIQLRVTFLGINANSSGPASDREAAPVAVLHVADGLALHAQHLRGRVLLARFWPMLDGAKLPDCALRSNSCRTWEKFASPMPLSSAAVRIDRSLSTAERSKR